FHKFTFIIAYNSYFEKREDEKSIDTVLFRSPIYDLIILFQRKYNIYRFTF
ncbi:MAG: hypothetical protein K0R34_4393, partial [Herbinix sp.]|nr:hypothetical protein [Herbinix sp.]